MPRPILHTSLTFITLLACALSLQAQRPAHDHAAHQAAIEPAPEKGAAIKLSLPEVAVLDQDGRRLDFYRDLVKGRVVAINFIFTTCTTICPPLGATFAKVQAQLGERAGRDAHLISISVDPVTDTPERLKAWGAKFNAGPGWTFVTGEKREIDRLLGALNASVTRREDHSPVVLIGDESKGDWVRAYGLAKPAQLLSLIEARVNAAAQSAGGHSPHRPPPKPAEPSAAERYFTDVELVNQHGEAVRFYSDLIKGKVVIINSFFTTCTSVCPPMNKNFARVQEALGDRLGRDVFIVSISVDPEHDTPARLKEYAAKFAARPGWHFLTGKKENVDRALYKLGQYVEAKDDHLTVVIIGNEPTGLWKKAHGLAKAEALIEVVNSVVNDKLPAQAGGGK
jgi:protein SCO1